VELRDTFRDIVARHLAFYLKNRIAFDTVARRKRSFASASTFGHDRAQL